MKLGIITLVAVIAASAQALASDYETTLNPGVERQTIAGTIGNSNAIDRLGLFGPKGANLAGAAMSATFEYDPRGLSKHSDCEQVQGCHIHESDPDAQSGSTTISTTIGGHTVTYTAEQGGRVDVINSNINMLKISAHFRPAAGQCCAGLAVQIAYRRPIGEALSLQGNAPVQGSRVPALLYFYDVAGNVSQIFAVTGVRTTS